MRRIKIITITLLIVLITMISFFGIYMPVQNRMENKVKEYNFSREIDGGRIVELRVATEDTDEDSNSGKVDAEKFNLENFEIVKSTLEERLKNLKAPDYLVSLDNESGNIIVELAEDDNVDVYIHYLTASRKVVMKEDDSDNELLTDEMIDEAQYTYTSNMEGKYKVTVELKLTEDGQAKLDEIVKNYAVFATEIEEIEAQIKAKEEAEKETDKESTEDSVEKTVEENAEKTEEVSTKKIARLTIAGTEYGIEKIEDNKIILTMGTETSNSTYINSYISQAAEICMLINSGEIPIDYELYNNRYMYSEIPSELKMYFVIGILAIFAIILVILVIKYRTRGLLVVISFVGYVSLLLLILRYTNVLISIEGICAIIIASIINLIVNIKILNRIKIMHLVKEAISGVYKEVFLKIIPIIIIIITFSFAGWSNLSSFGMIMFWGLTLTALYNIVITKTLLELRENK